MTLTDTEKKLLNNYQRDFPLVPEPFHLIAHQLNTDGATVLRLLHHLHQSGVISRVGPVFRPNTVGASTLAAVSVPPSKLISVADQINAHPEVNHNYERDHEFNLWFVVNTATQQRRDAVIKEIELETGMVVMSLPLVRDYHIDLGFDLDFSDVVPRRPTAPVRQNDDAPRATAVPRQQRDLVSVLQNGLPLTDRPFADVAVRTGLPESLVLKLIANMLRGGAMKRFGVVVRHHELGYRANAMCVWDIADNKVDEVGTMLARKPYVTLCYRRRRSPPSWPYNLFCMIHGKQRARVLQQLAELNAEPALENAPHSVLFSGRRFKQRGALYRHPQDAARDSALAAHG